MSLVSQARPFDPRDRRRARQWPLGLMVLTAAVLNAVVWGGLFSVARGFLKF